MLKENDLPKATKWAHSRGEIQTPDFLLCSSASVLYQVLLLQGTLMERKREKKASVAKLPTHSVLAVWKRGGCAKGKGCSISFFPTPVSFNNSLLTDCHTGVSDEGLYNHCLLDLTKAFWISRDAGAFPPFQDCLVSGRIFAMQLVTGNLRKAFFPTETSSKSLKENRVCGGGGGRALSSTHSHHLGVHLKNSVPLHS